MAKGWAVFSVDDEAAGVSLDGFLARYPPSTTASSEFAWICVQNARRDPEELEQAEDVDGLCAEWHALQERATLSAMQLSETHLDYLARRFGVLSGKWMVFCSRREIDAVWDSVARATHSGMLGATGAKVSPAKPLTGNAYDDAHVICVYAVDYMNEAEVAGIKDALRRLNVPGKLSFKPDVYTYCGIYSGNPWGIRPCKHYE